MALALADRKVDSCATTFGLPGMTGVRKKSEFQFLLDELDACQSDFVLRQCDKKLR